MQIQIVTFAINLLHFVKMVNGHTIAMGLLKKDPKKEIDKETERMLKKMESEAERKVMMFICGQKRKLLFCPHHDHDHR